MRYLLLLLLFATPALAQPNSYGAGALFAPGSPDSGNGTALGVCGEIAHDLGHGRVVLTGRACLDSGDKGYVGDGHNYRGLGEAHVYPFSHNDGLYLIGGVNYARQVNSQYSKAITNPLFGAGYNAHNQYLLWAGYLVPEHGPNLIRGWRLGTDLYRPLAPRWTFHAQAAYTRFTFYQPSGPLKGWHGSNSFQFVAGVLRTAAPSQAQVLAPPPAPRPDYTTLPSLSQHYATELGDYRLTIPNL